jgi:hypothetical protein
MTVRGSRNRDRGAVHKMSQLSVLSDDGKR